MTTTKHTPGPWAESDWMESFVSVTHDGYVVAEVQPKLWNGVPRITRAEVKANARLIAATPELLAALEAILAHPAAAQAEKRGSLVYAPEELRRARAAIAKAKGE